MSEAGAWVAIIVAILGGMTGGAALLRTFLEKPKIRADAMSLVNQAAIDTLQEARNIAAATQTELKEVKKELHEAEDRVDELEGREDLYVDGLRLLARHVRDLRSLMHEARMPVPDNPLPTEQLEQLLNRFRLRR